jgi:asparagine synthetase B (glutamine-hydrolysing)
MDIIKIEDLTEIITIGSQQIASYELVINNNRRTFIVTDFDRTTQDLALSVWFSDFLEEGNIRYKSYLNRKHVQQSLPLVISIKNKDLSDEVSASINSMTANVENGVFYLNVQNRTGGMKSFQLTEILS